MILGRGGTDSSPAMTVNETPLSFEFPSNCTRILAQLIQPSRACPMARLRDTHQAFSISRFLESDLVLNLANKPIVIKTTKGAHIAKFNSYHFFYQF